MPTFNVIRLSDGVSFPFSEIHKHSSVVVDFWNTSCVRCPAALAELNARASSKAKHVACALSVGAEQDYATFLKVRELSDEFPNLDHYFLPFEEKEAAKAELGFSQLPYQVQLG